MKAIAFANRLMRDLNESSLLELTADARLELVDAINASIQTLDSLAGSKTKITEVSIPLAAPAIKTVSATNGSTEITGGDFTGDQLYCSITLDGDPIQNQIVGENSLLHPYQGTGGSVTATVYSDAVALPEPYIELVGHPRFLDDDYPLLPFSGSDTYNYINTTSKDTGRPRWYWVEENSMNQSPPAPAVIRFSTLPEKSYRLTCRALMGPARVKFSDLLSPAANLPVRENHIESYLLPIARGNLSHSSLWRDKETKKEAQDAADLAKREFAIFTPTTLQTPANTVRTRPGF